MDNVYLIKAKENRTIIVASSIEDALNLYNDEDNGLDYSPEPTEPVRAMTDEEIKAFLVIFDIDSDFDTDDEDGNAMSLTEYMENYSLEVPRIVLSTLYVG